MTGTSIRRPHDCFDNVEGESGPYLYCSACFLGFRFSSRGPAAHKTCKICIVVASVGSSPGSWYAHQSTARSRQNASKWSAVPASLIVLWHLRPGPRRRPLIQRVTALYEPTHVVCSCRIPTRKHGLHEDASGHAPGCSSTSRGGAFAESGQRRGSLSPMRTK